MEHPLAVRVMPISASGNKRDEGVDLIAVSTDGGTIWWNHAAPGKIALLMTSPCDVYYDIYRGKAAVKIAAHGRASSVPKGVLFRFYEELNDYLPEKSRKKELRFELDKPTTAGEAIAALGIPPGEIDLILVNGASVGLDYRLTNGDRVSVYPIFERLDISGVTKVREKPLIKLRAIKK